MTTKMWRFVFWAVSAPLVGLLLYVYRPGDSSRTNTTREDRIDMWQTWGGPTVIGIIILAAVVTWILARLRLAKSRSTWQLMGDGRPNDARYLLFVYQRTRQDLERLGWRLRGPSYAPVPVIGVSFGRTEITFWEAGTADPTLRVRYDDIHGIALTDESGDWPRPALSLRLDGNPKPSLSRREAQHRRDIILSLRGAAHAEVAEDEQVRLIEQLHSKLSQP